VKTDRRLVTDAEAADIRQQSELHYSIGEVWIERLLYTREELIAALERCLEKATKHDDGDIEEIARAILAQVRGES
jgi:hypothetical protein